MNHPRHTRSNPNRQTPVTGDQIAEILRSGIHLDTETLSDPVSSDQPREPIGSERGCEPQ